MDDYLKDLLPETPVIPIEEESKIESVPVTFQDYSPVAQHEAIPEIQRENIQVLQQDIVQNFAGEPAKPTANEVPQQETPVYQTPYQPPQQPISYYHQPPAAPYPIYQSPSYQTPYQTTPPAPVQPIKKKERKGFGWGSILATALITAIICGMVSSGATYLVTRTLLGNSSSGGYTEGLSPIVSVTESNMTNIEAIASAASPSVVGIRVTYNNMSFFGESYDSTGEGSGIIYSSDGYILTNYHVIAPSSTSSYQYNPFGGRGNSDSEASSEVIEVFLSESDTTGIPATVVGYDSTLDLAVLKIDKTGLVPLAIGDSSELKVGELAVAIGNPGGLNFMGSISLGVISGLNRTIQTENGVQMSLIQTDAAINPGNSGGALVDSEGKLIGINNSKMTGDGFEGMGFAIPINTAVETAERLIKNENTPKPVIGIYENSYYDASTLTRMGYPAGVVVDSVMSGSPAEKAGLRQNDIITALNGAATESMEQLTNEKNKYAPGDTVTLTIFRGTESIDVSLTLGQ